MTQSSCLRVLPMRVLVVATLLLVRSCMKSWKHMNGIEITRCGGGGAAFAYRLTVPVKRVLGFAQKNTWAQGSWELGSSSTFSTSSWISLPLVRASLKGFVELFRWP